MILVRKNGKSLEVRVYAGKDPLTGKERYRSKTIQGTGRDARQAAKAEEARLLAEVRRTKPGNEKTTVTELFARWFEVARHEASTRTRQEPLIAKHITSRIGDVPVAKLTREHLDLLYLALERDAGLAPASIARLHGSVHAALAQAVTWEWIDRNPAAGTRRPEVPRPDPHPPTATVVAQLMAAAWEKRPDLACFIRAGAATGMRRGETCALRRSNLLLDAGVLRKTHAIGEAAGVAYEKEPKNLRRHALALDPGTVEALRDQLARVDARARDLDVRLVADPFVFTWEPDGSQPWQPGRVTKAFARLRKTVPGAENVTLRSLRHFVTTTLLEGGASISTVTQRGGWARSSTPLNTYAAFLPAGDLEAAQIMGDTLDPE